MALETILQQFRNNLSRDYVASGVIGLDGIHVAFDSTGPNYAEAKVAAELADGLKDMMELVKNTDSGNINYITISTDRYKLFLHPIAGNNGKYFNALTINANGNMGKAILELQKVEKALKDELA